MPGVCSRVLDSLLARRDAEYDLTRDFDTSSITRAEHAHDLVKPASPRLQLDPKETLVSGGAFVNI